MSSFFIFPPVPQPRVSVYLLSSLFFSASEMTKIISVAMIIITRNGDHSTSTSTNKTSPCPLSLPAPDGLGPVVGLNDPRESGSPAN